MSIKVQSLLRVYEQDGKETPGINASEIAVSSHGIFNDRVVLWIEGRSYTVIARDLIEATGNATRTAA